MITDFATRKTAQDLLISAVTMSEHRALTLIAEATSAIIKLHSDGEVHRNLKPSNIFLFAAQPDSQTSADFTVRVGHPRSSVLMKFAAVTTMARFDRPDYRAPEDIPVAASSAPAPLESAADVYSLVASLFGLLFGSAPYFRPGQSAIQQLSSIVNDQIIIPTQPVVSAATHQLLLDGLNRSPEARIASAEELKQRILETQEELARECHN